MPTVEIPYGPWVPSAPDYRKGGCVVADNVIPRPMGGYGPLRGKSSTEDSVDGAVIGSQAFWGIDGTSHIAAGTANSLIIRTPTNVTQRYVGINQVPDGEAWDFAQFNDMIFATSSTNKLKYLEDIDTDTTWNVVPNVPPKSKYCARVGNFLMLGGLTDQPNRIQWSAFNNPLGEWTTSRINQSGFADMPREFGPVQRVVGGRFAIVFQERGINTLQYVGPPGVFRRETLEEGTGCAAPFSVVTVGFRTFFLAQDGFKATNGSEVVNIGAGRVNQWFFENASVPRLKRTQGAIDWENQCVMWAWCSAGNETPNRLLVYSWAEDRWTSGTINADWIVGCQLDYTTLEQIGAAYPDLDVDVPVDLDDDFWQGEGRGLAIWEEADQRSTLYMMQGTTLAAEFQTAEMEPAPGRRVFVSEVWPLIEDASQASTFATVVRANDASQTTSAYSAIGAAGFAPLRADGRTVALSQKIPAGTAWNDAQGAQVTFRVSGKR